MKSRRPSYAYRLMDKRLRERGTPYALHLGITEAGLPRDGTIKVSIGLGILLLGRHRRHPSRLPGGRSGRRSPRLLGYSQSLGLREKGFEITACPSCGRAEIAVVDLAERSKHREIVHGAGQSCRHGLRGERTRRIEDGRRGRSRRQRQGRIYRAGELVGTFPEDRTARCFGTRSKKSSPRSIRTTATRSAH